MRIAVLLLSFALSVSAQVPRNTMQWLQRAAIPAAPPAGFDPAAFVTVWIVTNNQTITLPTPSGAGITYNYTVDWGDGNSSIVTTPNTNHVYATGGTYTNVITGTCEKWYFNNGGNRTNLVQILQFGTVGFEQLNNAFYGCAGLTGSIPSLSGLTNLTTISLTFLSCSGLTGSIPSLDGLIKLTSISYAFQGCTGLTGSIPNLSGLTKLTTIYYAFSGCTGLTGSIPSLDGLIKLTSISYAFTGCTGLTGSIPSLDGLTNLTTIDAAFQACAGLTGSIPSLSGLTNLTTIAFAFLSCSGLTGSIPSLDGLIKLTSISYAFSGCTGLTGSIPSLDGLTNLTTIAYAFYGCTGLTNNTATVADVFGAPAYFPKLTTANQCFSGMRWCIGNASDFTGGTFDPTFVVSTSSSSGSYRMFYGQTNLTDYATLGAEWK